MDSGPGSADDLLAEYRDRVFRALASVNRLAYNSTPAHFSRASTHLDEALTLGLQLIGADEPPPGPGVVARMRALYEQINPDDSPAE